MPLERLIFWKYEHVGNVNLRYFERLLVEEGS